MGEPTSSAKAPAFDRARLAKACIGLGLVAWLIAQVLPAFRYHDTLSNAPVSYMPGGQLTFVGWAYAGVGAEDSNYGGAGPLYLGWFASIWFLGALTAYARRHLGVARSLAIVAFLSGMEGVWATANFTAYSEVQGLELGAWVWLAALGLVLAGMAVTRPSPR